MDRITKNRKHVAALNAQPNQKPLRCYGKGGVKLINLISRSTISKLKFEHDKMYTR